MTMMRLVTLRTLCYVFAIATLGVFWYWVNTQLVNDLLNGAESSAKVLAKFVARQFGIGQYKTEAIVVGKMHIDRTLLIASLILAWAMAIEFIFREFFGRNTWRTVLAIVVVHSALIAIWLQWTPQTEAWYAVHADLLKATFRYFRWDKAETLFLNLLKIQSILVLGEAFLVYFLLTSRIGRRR